MQIQADNIFSYSMGSHFQAAPFPVFEDISLSTFLKYCINNFPHLNYRQPKRPNALTDRRAELILAK